MSYHGNVSLTLNEVESLIREGTYNLIPVFSNFIADLETPLSAFLKVRGQTESSFLFESVEGGERQARYSIIGTEPYKTLTQNDVDPLIEIGKELSKYKVLPLRDLPLTGGGFGYIGYDCVRFYEPTVKISNNNQLAVPDSIFMFCNSLIVFDHVQHNIKIVAHVFADKNQSSDEINKLYDECLSRIEVLYNRLSQPLPAKHVIVKQSSNPNLSNNPSPLHSHIPPEEYKRYVLSLKEAICNGDLIQGVPSFRTSRVLPNNVGGFDVYRQLRMLNPSPYMFYLDLKNKEHANLNFEIVGASPEQLVKVDKNNRVSTHPIAGTRVRGKTEAQDEALAKELREDIKERAEHIMLVDLGRNDTGRVSVPGSVRVDSLMDVERYSHVMHLVSRVSGDLDTKRGLTVYDAFRSVFPAGTVTGAPKVKAMQLVAGLENERRGIYAGAVGYIAFNGVLDTAISLRTMVVKNKTAYLQAGAGIVYDSVPDSEHLECVNKMKALNIAIDRAIESVSPITISPSIKSAQPQSFPASI